jgi:flagellar motor switch protein FliN
VIDEDAPIEEPVAVAEPDVAVEPEVEFQADMLPAAAEADSVSSVSIRDIVVRVGAELGRATLPLAKAVGLSPGAVIELDRAADDPIDLYVNGRRFATGQLLLIDQTDWAIRIENVLEVELPPAAPAGPSPDDLI